ncbi:MAG: hypothetical protein KDD89_04690 [Anaerolineales bacterium]|nr:hypothetical protein [Anaerolineales bacterium]
MGLKRWWQGKNYLTKAEKKLLTAVANGQTLKSHRYLDGTKQYKLWPPPNESDAATPETIPYEMVQSLLEKKLLTTNQKFPAATFLLTNAGKRRVAQWDESVRGVADVVNFDG